MARCTVTQPDSHTIRVDADGGSFRIPYRFFWDGHEREPESVVLEESRGRHEVRAFFLFGTIGDAIDCDARGISIDRTWSVKSMGTVRLTFDLEFDIPDPAAVLFPGVEACRAVDSWISVPGDRTSYPLALFVRGGRSQALIWSESAGMGDEKASIGACRVDRDEEPSCVRVQLRAPGAGEPRTRSGPRPGDIVEPVDGVLQAQGNLSVSHRVHVAFAPAGAIQTRGPSCVLARRDEMCLRRRDEGEASADAKEMRAKARRGERTARPSVNRERLREALSACLSTHLYQSGGVAGLRETPGSQRLSLSAGVGAAVLARRLFPGDARMAELALRLADFALRGQHPSGLFFTAFDQRAGEWAGVPGKTRQALLSTADAARTADSLLTLAEDLAADGLPHEKYWLAGLRFVEFFIDGKARLCLPGELHTPDEHAAAEEGNARQGAPERNARQGAPEGTVGMGLFTPLARVSARTGRDRHKKPLDDLARLFSAAAWDAFDPPSSRVGRGADAEASLLAARLFVEMRRMGYRPAEPTGGTPSVQKKRAAAATLLFASLLVPWIRAHPPGTSPDTLADGAPRAGSGLLADSFVRQRLLPSGHEAAWVLLGLRGMAGDGVVSALLRRLALLCLEGAARLPVGTAWLQHTGWDAEGKPGQTIGTVGPVDSRRLVREVGYGLRLLDDFPRL